MDKSFGVIPTLRKSDPTESNKRSIMKSIISLICISLLVGLTLSSCVKQVKSCAGIMTHPKCAKFCTHSAVATCEASRRADARQLRRDIQEAVNRPYRND